MTVTEPSTELELAPPRAALDTFQVAEHAWRLAQKICKTEFVPKGLQNRPEACLAAILKGHELDLPPMYALASIFLINGRPGMYAETQRAIVQRAGHEIWFEELTNTRVTVAGRRADNGRELRVTWTWDDVVKAKLDGKDTYKQFPRNMLVARSSADLCRFQFSDVTGGLYTVEEIEEMPALDDGPAAAAALPAAPAAPTNGSGATRKAAAPTARARKKAPAKQASAPAGEPPLPPLPNEVDDAASGSAPRDEGAEAGSDEPSGSAAEDPAVIERAKRIAMKCKDLDLDRAEVIYAVTNGEKTSAKALTGDEAVEVLEALRHIKDGTKRLDTDDDVPVLVDVDRDAITDAEVVDDWDNNYGAEADWDTDTWRRYLAARQVKVVAVIKEAQKLAKELGEPEPPNLGALQGRVSLASLVRGFIEEQAELAGGES